MKFKDWKEVCPWLMNTDFHEDECRASALGKWDSMNRCDCKYCPFWAFKKMLEDNIK